MELLSKTYVSHLFRPTIMLVVALTIATSPVLHASETRSLHYSLAARSASSDKALDGLYAWEMFDEADVNRVFLRGYQGERLVTTLANSGATGTRLLTLLDDETGWWVTVSFTYDVSNLTLHRFLRGGDHGNADLRLHTSTGLTFEVLDVPSNDHSVDVFLRRLQASAVYERFVGEIPLRTAQLAQTILSVDRQHEHPQFRVLNLASDYLKMLTWPMAATEPSIEEWNVTTGAFTNGLEVTSAALRSLLSQFTHAGKEADPLWGGHTRDLFEDTNSHYDGKE